MLLGQLCKQAEAGQRHEQAAHCRQHYERLRHDSDLLRELLMKRTPGGERLGYTDPG